MPVFFLLGSWATFYTTASKCTNHTCLKPGSLRKQCFPNSFVKLLLQRYVNFSPRSKSCIYSIRWKAAQNSKYAYKHSMFLPFVFLRVLHHTRPKYAWGPFIDRLQSTSYHDREN